MDGGGLSARAAPGLFPFLDDPQVPASSAAPLGDLRADLGWFERRLHENGFERVAGVDEAGRGALAGPLVAAAVILPRDLDCPELRDSKALTARQRERCFEAIAPAAVAMAVVRAMPGRIDRRGLHRSNLSLLRRAVMSLPVEPDFVLFDGFAPRRAGPWPTLSMRKGDACAASVAAASIVAKVTRDRMMDRYHRRFPGYGFDRNRGYGTREHFRALNRLGPSPVHRLSFKGVGWIQLSLGPMIREALASAQSHNGGEREGAEG